MAATSPEPTARPGLVARAMLALVRFYQRFVSPLTPPSCRYFPTCSGYAVDVVTRHGAVRGGVLAAARICRCHPFHDGGLDPAPGSALEAKLVAEGKLPPCREGLAARLVGRDRAGLVDEGSPGPGPVGGPDGASPNPSGAR